MKNIVAVVKLFAISSLFFSLHTAAQNSPKPPADNVDPKGSKGTPVDTSPTSIPTMSPESGGYLSTTPVYGPEMVSTFISAFIHVTWVSLPNPRDIPGSLSQSGFIMLGSVMNPSAGGQGYVAYHPQIKRLIVAFRGTKGAAPQQTAHNVAVDGNFRMKNLDWLSPSEPSAQIFRSLRVHSGFNNEYGRFRPDLQAAIKQFRNTVQNWDEYEFFFVGFSLGSALATHAALDIQLTVLDPLNSSAAGPVFRRYANVYLGGTPRVGDDTFRQRFGAKINNIVRANLRQDPVARIPVEAQGYRHIGRLLPLEFNGTLSTSNQIQYLAREPIDRSHHDYNVYLRSLYTLLQNGRPAQAGDSYYPAGLLVKYGDLERL